MMNLEFLDGSSIYVFLMENIVLIFNFSCFLQTLRINRVAKSEHMDEEKTDSLLPADGWSSELVDLYKQLTSDLIENGSGDWIEHRTAWHDGEKRLFTKAVISEFPGKFFEYQFFFSKKEQRIKGVVQFGPYTQGPPG